MSKTTITAGTRKRAVARATLSPGKGLVSVNGIPLDQVTPLMMQMKYSTPLILAGDMVKKFDIQVNVSGGGINSQAEAASLAIAKALVEQDESLEQTFLDYDRRLLVADVRRREQRKPNRHGKARSKVQKSYR